MTTKPRITDAVARTMRPRTPAPGSDIRIERRRITDAVARAMRPRPSPPPPPKAPGSTPAAP